MNSLSVLPYFLSLQLTKKETMEIVKKKRYKKDDTKASLIEMVNQHFVNHRNLQEVRQRKEKSKKKLFSIFNVLVFLGKLKHKVILNSRRNVKRYSIHYSYTEDNINPFVDYDSFALVDKVKVKFQFITKKTKLKKYLSKRFSKSCRSGCVHPRRAKLCLRI